MKKTRIILLSIFVFLLFLGCVLTPRVLELLAYHDATSADSPSKTVEACDAYLNKYQDGKHEYDVLVLKAINSEKPIATIQLCLEKYPDGRFNLLLGEYQDYLKSHTNCTYDDFIKEKGISE